jgi:hypothetical protein
MMQIVNLQGGGMQEEKPTGRARGGKARMASLTPEQRKENARAAVQAKAALKKLPKATHSGQLVTNLIDLPCFVLDDGRRVISGRGLTTAIGMKGRGGGVSRVAEHKLIKAYGDPALIAAIDNPIQFVGKSPKGDNVPSDGYEAHVLQEVCEAILTARDNNLLVTEQDQRYAAQADILMRAFARVGIVALIDEATGYQKDRDKQALAKILEAFVAKELQPWLKTFPDEYYSELFRIYNIPYPPLGNPSWRPGFIGHVTNNVVYDRIAPGLLPELKRLASKEERKARLHQHLTQDVGHPKLQSHMGSIVTLLKLSRSPEDFYSLVDRLHPRFGTTGQLDFDDPLNK